MAGTIKLYQIGRYGKPDSRKETVYYFDVKDRKRIIDGWFNFYGSGMANHFIQVAPEVDLRKTKRTKSKPFIVANVRDILDQYDREEMSFSRMTEMFNEVAFKWADEARREAAVRFEKELAEKDRIIAQLRADLDRLDKKRTEGPY